MFLQLEGKIERSFTSVFKESIGQLARKKKKHPDGEIVELFHHLFDAPRWADGGGHNVWRCALVLTIVSKASPGIVFLCSVIIIVEGVIVVVYKALFLSSKVV